MKKLIVFSNKKNSYTPQLNKLVKVFDKKNINYSLSSFLKFKKEKLKVDVVITDGITYKQYNYFNKKNIIIINFGNINKNYSTSDIIIDYKYNNPINDFYDFKIDYKDPRFEKFLNLFDLVSLLKWDTKFWGYNVAAVRSYQLNSNIWIKINKFLKNNKIRLLEYLCNCHDKRSVRTAELNGFKFVDIRLTFQADINKINLIKLPSDMVFRKAEKYDIQYLKKISKNLYKDSRYLFDDFFNRKKINQFYENWIEKGVLGFFDNECFCLCLDNQPVAFCTISYFKNFTSSIGLIGVSRDFQGKQYARYMLNNLFIYLFRKNFTKISVVTQGRNYAAQNLYQRIGFKIIKTQLWYHKWI